MFEPGGAQPVVVLRLSRVAGSIGIVLAVVILAVAWWANKSAVPVTAEDNSGRCGAPNLTFLRAPVLSTWRELFAAVVNVSPLAGDAEQDRLDVSDPEQLRILIDEDTLTLTLFEGDRVVERFPVAMGKAQTPSPPGEWRVVHKDRGWGGGFGTRWLGLNVPWGIYGIHGTNVPSSIGQSASAGCIRMHNRDVERLWDVVPLDTPVTITGDLPDVSGRELIAEGQTGKFISVLQFRLRQAGYDFGVLDGRFGPATGAAIRNLQVLIGAEPTGELTRDQQRFLWFPE